MPHSALRPSFQSGACFALGEACPCSRLAPRPARSRLATIRTPTRRRRSELRQSVSGRPPGQYPPAVHHVHDAKCSSSVPPAAAGGKLSTRHHDTSEQYVAIGVHRLQTMHDSRRSTRWNVPGATLMSVPHSTHGTKKPFNIGFSPSFARGPFPGPEVPTGHRLHGASRLVSRAQRAKRAESGASLDMSSPVLGRAPSVRKSVRAKRARWIGCERSECERSERKSKSPSGLYLTLPNPPHP